MAAKSKIKKNTKIRWTSKGPAGTKKREGIVRGFVPAGEPIKFPKSADPAKFKAETTNQIHNRYLVEIPRVHGKTGKKIASHWLAPKAVTLESSFKAI